MMKSLMRALMVWVLLVVAFSLAFLVIDGGSDSHKWLNQLIARLKISAIVTAPVAIVVWLFGLRSARRERDRQNIQTLIEQPFPQGEVVFSYLHKSRRAVVALILLCPVILLLGVKLHEWSRLDQVDVGLWLMLALIFLTLLPTLWRALVHLRVALSGGFTVRVGQEYVQLPVFKHLKYHRAEVSLAGLSFVSIMGKRAGVRSLCFGSSKDRYVLEERHSNEVEFMRMYRLIRQRALEIKKQQNSTLKSVTQGDT